MIETAETMVVAADWVMPVATPPIPNGLIAIRNGMVEFIGRDLPIKYWSAKRFELQGQAILPGLINSHCHLEFSDLQEPIPADGSFPDWIRRLLAYRRSKNQSPEQATVARREAILTGIRESYLSGVRWVVDMTTQPWDPAWLELAGKEILSMVASPRRTLLVPIVVQPCIEVLDISKTRFDETLAYAIEQIAAPESIQMGKVGLAPHAPYTASRAVTRKCVELSIQAGRLISMHLAESTDEMDWIEKGIGPFREFLEPIIETDYLEDIGQISDHLRLLAAAEKVLVVHGNYLSHRDLADLAGQAQSMSIVHCPRTHLHFGHRHGDSLQYPLSERLTLGVKHLLGTDSRASNPNLNLWSEAQQLRADHPSVSGESILRMITTDAAEFLGVASRCGTIRVGLPASLTVVSLGSHAPNPTSLQSTKQAYELVLASDTKTSPLEIAIQSQAFSLKSM